MHTALHFTTVLDDGAPRDSAGIPLAYYSYCVVPILYRQAGQWSSSFKFPFPFPWRGGNTTVVSRIVFGRQLLYPDRLQSSLGKSHTQINFYSFDKTLMNYIIHKVQSAIHLKINSLMKFARAMCYDNLNFQRSHK